MKGFKNSPAMANLMQILYYWNMTFHDDIREYNLKKYEKSVLCSYTKLPADEVQRALRRYKDAVGSNLVRKVSIHDFFFQNSPVRVWDYLDDAIALKEKQHAAPPGEKIVSEVEEKLRHYAEFNRELEEDNQIILWRDAYGNRAVDLALKKIKRG